MKTIREFDLSLITKNKSVKQKLRPFSLKFRLQFGQRLNILRRFTRFWLNRCYKWRNLRIFKARRRRRRRYHYQLMKEGISYLKYMVLRKSKMMNMKGCEKIFYGFSFKPSRKLKKILFEREMKISFLCYRIKKRQYYGQKAVRFIKYKKLLKIRLNKRKRKVLKKLNMRTKISLVNSWLPFFHKKNLRKLFKTVTKKSLLSLSKFLKSWKIVNKQFFFSIYNWFAFYCFRVIHGKIANSNYYFFSTQKRTLNVVLKYKDFCNYIYIILNYKVLISKFIFIFERFRVKNLFFFLTTIKENPWAERIKPEMKPFGLVLKKGPSGSEEKLFSSILKMLYNVEHPKQKNKNKNKLKLKTLCSVLKKKKVFSSSIYFYLNLVYKTDFFKKNVNNFKYKHLVLVKKKFFFKSLLMNFKVKQKVKKLIKFSANKFFFKNLLIVEPLKNFLTKGQKNFYTHFYFWLFLQENFNALLYRKLFTPYNLWMFFLNYSLNYYIFHKLYIVFFNYFFFIISQKFKQLVLKLRLTGFKLCYEFIKYKDNSRYHLGIKPHSFVTTFNRRIKKGFQFSRFSKI